jgi:dienelactone hydrolase
MRGTCCKEVKMKALFTMIAVVLMLGLAHAEGEIVTRALEYEHEGKILEGFLAYDASIEGKRPGILVIHEWWGLNDYARRRAEDLAAMGYVAFALDMYGKGVLAQTPEEASKLAGGLYADRELMRSRAQAGLDVLASHRFTDPDRLAAIGFCFGGTTALELAMSGAPLQATVTFHGGLGFPDTRGLEAIEGSVLIQHGGSDPHVPREDLVKIWGAMEEAGVDYEIDIYGGAVHSFTNPASGDDPSTGSAYDEVAARRSWSRMQEVFEERF